ncbi:hypothetical protein [Limobrevibacterium gyesilva]|uniref:Uncharacterized protein n=1 Tax=Limobrevibacterium gyesilva TaxID=2991712 RepID=A0AA42CG83_9PROT|nr:hypothetical protein [Limobrevibacterium gyesilva]MCW3475771.1 hypothetical protein [Limobrevibacterium gyesilva]
MAGGVALAAAGLTGVAGRMIDFAWVASPRAAAMGGRVAGAAIRMIAQGGLPLVLSACAVVLGVGAVSFALRARSVPPRT